MQTLSVDQLVGQVLGNYRLERFLGKGRLNAVYLARHLASQRTDALALYLIPERFSRDARDLFLARFRKEAAGITTLDHPHILPVYEYGEYPGYPYLVTPYMMQGSLADVLKRKGRCDHTFVLSILEQLVAGITYAHARGFVHGTLKPANVLLYTEDTMQVAGFGLLPMLQLRGIEQNAQPYAHLLSIADTLLAAPEYIAPEVVQGQAVDIHSDIYSLGCILFELLSGQPPFRGEKPLEVARQHVTQTVPSLRKLSPDVPVALSSVVHQALERDPAQRFQSVAELGEAFAQASKGATRYEEQRMASAEISQTRKQETPREGYAVRDWQQSPLMTDSVPAVKTSFRQTGKQSARLRAGATDKWQLVPPIVTGHLPVLEASKTATSTPLATAISASPTLPPVSAQEMTTQVQPLPTSPASPAAKQAPATPPKTTPPASMAAGIESSMPGANADTADLVKAYEWWSPADPLQAPPPQKASASRSERTKQEPIANEVDWTADPLPTEGSRRGRKPKAARQSDKMQRRKVVAFLAAGGVAAAGTALFLNFGHLMGTPATQPATQTTAQPMDGNMKPGGQAQQVPTQQTNNQGKQANTQAPAATNTQAPAKNGQMTMQDAPAAKNGIVIGSAGQMVNSSADFTNPADKKMSLLIHLPDGNFVAYEKACTHEGVNVNYDPATKMLICPAHGAIFDPAKGASVVQGPAEQPLPVVHIKVGGDGTITAV